MSKEINELHPSGQICLFKEQANNNEKTTDIMF